MDGRKVLDGSYTDDYEGQRQHDFTKNSNNFQKFSQFGDRFYSTQNSFSSKKSSLPA